MRRATLVLALCLLLVAAAPAQKKTVPLVIQGDTVLVVKSVPFKIVAPEGAFDYTWLPPEGVFGKDEDNVYTVTKAPPGEFVVRVKILYLEKDKAPRKDYGEVKVTLGSPTPVPPGPDPKPPDPKPGDLPIAGEGFRVLIVRDAKNEAKLPEPQQIIVFDKTVRDYLAAKCPKGADNKTPERRFWDKGVDASGQPQLWQDALKRANEKCKGTYPWIALSNGKAGYEGPLPESVEKTLELLKKYGN